MTDPIRSLSLLDVDRTGGGRASVRPVSGGVMLLGMLGLGARTHIATEPKQAAA